MKFFSIFFLIFILIPIKINAKIIVNFDSSYPINKKEIVLNYHKKINTILEKLTGFEPDVEFTIKYSPDSHRGLIKDYSILIDPDTPPDDNSTNLNDWYWWYLIEITHFYIPDINIWQNNPELAKKYKKYFNPYMAIREHEYLSHAITEFIILNYFNNSKEFLKLNNKPYEFYLKQHYSWLNPLRDIAITTISPQTIFQIDTNYNNFNAFSCDIAASMFYKFIYYDKNFLKNFIKNIQNNKISTIEDYIDLIVNSTKLKTINDMAVKQWLKFYPYFTRFEDKNLTEYSLDIIPISKSDKITYEWHRINYVNPSYFIITGSSIKNLGDYTGNYLDNDFFEKHLYYKILDKNNQIVYEGDTKISPNLWSYRNYIPNLPVGKYKIITSFVTIDNVSLKDEIYFYVTKENNLYDDKNKLLIINNLKYENNYFDLITKFYSDDFTFKILSLTEDNLAKEKHGFVKDFDNIFLDNVIIGDKLFNILLGVKNEKLYFKGLY